MTESLDLSMDGVERRSLADFTEQAYLNYSMYVIMDRALPHIGDGLDAFCQQQVREFA